MPVYSNPATMFGATPLGANNPLNGALVGQSNAYAQQIADQGIADDKLKFMEEMHKYYNDQLDDPMKAAGRSESIAKSNYNTDFMTSGKQAAKDTAGLDQTIANTKNTNAEADDRIKKLRADLVVQTNDELKQAPIDWTNPEDKKRWTNIQDQFRKVGVGTPPIPDQKWYSALDAKANSLVNDRGVQQKNSEDTTKAQTKLQYEILPTIAGQTSARMSEIGLQNQGKLAETKARTDSAAAIAKYKIDSATRYEQLATQILQKAQEGKPVSESEQALVLDQKWAEAIKTNPRLLIQSIGDQGETEAQWKEQAKARLFGNTTPAASSTSSTSAESKMITVGKNNENYDKVPKGATYIGPDGKMYKKGS